MTSELKVEKEFEMREEYDIPANAERGKFYSPKATYTYPIYLDRDVLKYFTDLADSRGIEPRVFLSELLRRQMPASGSEDAERR